MTTKRKRGKGIKNEATRAVVLRKFLQDGVVDIGRIAQAVKLPRSVVQDWLGDISIEEFATYLKPVVQAATVQAAHSFREMSSVVEQENDDPEEAERLANLANTRSNAAKKHRENAVASYRLLASLEELSPATVGDIDDDIPEM